MKRKVTALALTVALSALTLSGCAQLPQFPQRQSTEESTGEETTEGTTEESTESSSEETTEETSETSGTSESTEENNGTTLSDAEAAAVGTYIGGNGSCFTLHEDASCSFFDLNSDNVQQGLTWSISGGKINIVWRSAGLILTFDVPESSDTPIEVTGNNSSWNAELFAKVSDKDEELTADDYKNYRSNLFSLPDLTESDDYNEKKNVSASLEGVDFEVPETFREQDSSQSGTISYVIDDGTPGTEVILSMQGMNGFSGAIFVNRLLNGLDAEGTWIRDYTFSDDGCDAVVTGITTTDSGTTFVFHADAHYVQTNGTALYAVVYEPMDAKESHFDDLDSVFTSFVRGYQDAAGTGGYSGGSAGSSGGGYDNGSSSSVDPFMPLLPGDGSTEDPYSDFDS